MITLTTDFGDGAYAGAVRGSILSVHPEARIVDVTHAVPAHDVLQGALALYAAAPYFPPGTLHVAVVDPGVGTARRPLLVEAEGAAFLGPDNGLLIPAATRLGLKRVRVLDEPRFWRGEVSPVFHGRDVFGPVAGHLSAGARFDDVGTVVDDPVPLDFGRPHVREDGALEAKVLAVDAFGNVVTNVTAADLASAADGEMALVRVGDAKLRVPFARAYGEVPAGEALLLVGSAGFVELGMNRGSAARTFDVRAGDAVVIARAP